MLEGEYIQNRLLIKYYIDIINSINQMLSINKKYFNIDEIINSVIDVINNYNNIYEKEKGEKLYPLLFKAFNEMMNLFFNDDNVVNIINNSIYGKNILNENNNATNMNLTNLNINSKLNETFNNTLNNININNKMNNNILSSFSPRQNMSINNFEKNNNQILNKTFSPFNNQRYNNDSIINININNDINQTSIPQISQEFLEKLSKDNIQKYNVIQNFLINEENNIKEELNLYSQKKNSENKLNILYQSGEFSQYNNILNQICQEENDKTNQYFRNINSKSKIFELLKKNIKDNFAFIEKYLNRINIVDNKFNQIMNNIEEYKNNFYGFNNIFARINNNSYFNNNMDNVLNKTFSLADNKRNNNYYNKYFNDNSLINPINNNFNFQ